MDRTFIQIISVVVGTVGISIYFNIDKSKLPIITLGGLISWTVYLTCTELNQNIFMSCFISSIVISIYAEIAARLFKSPANIFLIPSIVPLLPGGSFYHMMTGCINMDIEMIKSKGFETMMTVLGISVGVVLGFFIFKNVFNKIKTNKDKKFKREKEKEDKEIQSISPAYSD